MTMTVEGKTLYLNAVDPVTIVGHTAEPNATGTTNRIGSPVACSFNASSAGSNRGLASDVSVAVPAGVTTWTHFSVYNSGNVCIHIASLNTPRSGLVEGDTIVFKSSGPDAIVISAS